MEALSHPELKLSETVPDFFGEHLDFRPLAPKDFSKKWIRRCQIEAIAEGYKRAIDEIRGPIAKNGLSGQNPKILAKKKGFTF